MMSIAIMAVVSAMIYEWVYNAVPTLQADSGMQFVEAQLRQARETAVDQRRNILVTFQGTAEIVTQIQNLNVTTTPPTVTSTTTLSDYKLDPNQMVFTVLAGIPDTPDGFGKTTAISFTDTSTNTQQCSSLPCTITFQSDGTVVDSSGNYVNGTVFIAMVKNNLMARAITILGATGRIKGYRYHGNVWF